MGWYKYVLEVGLLKFARKLDVIGKGRKTREHLSLPCENRPFTEIRKIEIKLD